MTKESLVRTLFEGDLDIVGDVHGEIGALESLLGELGYDSSGHHPDGRRLVFVGDLTDRGPDSPAVVRLVAELVASGRAQCILGNHELNLLMKYEKPENGWFVGDESRGNGREVAADESTRDVIIKFFGSLPMALERPGLRVVHACWNDEAIEQVRPHSDAAGLYRDHQSRIGQELSGRGKLDRIGINLVFQNENPVRMITSGPEERAAEKHFAGGKWRQEQRVRWWEGLASEPVCVFGHYSMPVDRPHDFGSAVCVDYGVGRRAKERTEVGDDGPFVTTRLAALRWPEREMVFDAADPGSR